MESYVVGIGEALWDMLPAGKQLGGAPSNFVYHITQLGLSAKVVTALGCDVLGDEIAELFQSKQIASLVSRVSHPTGTVQIELDEAGVPSYEIKTEVAWDYIPYNLAMKELARSTQVVCFGSLAQRSEMSRNTIYRFLEAMPETEEVLKVFDINLRQQFYTKEIIQESLKRCNILKINDEELVTVGRLFDIKNVSAVEQCRELLHKYELKMVILTCGEKGSYVVSENQSSYKETPKVDVVDTVGAGDAFTAAFIAGLLKGKSITDAHRLAVNVAAYICTQPGAMPEISYIKTLV